jgi:hypothetical protein
MFVQHWEARVKQSAAEITQHPLLPKKLLQKKVATKLFGSMLKNVNGLKRWVA